MTTYCPTCHGLGEIPSGGQTMTSATSMSWGTCPDCHGAGVAYDCPACCDTGVNVYADDFDPAHPAPCQHCHPTPEPTPAPAVVWGGVTVDAPGFSQDQFERAMMRAFADDLQITQDGSGVHVVYHPGQTSGYAVTRTRCGCPAGDKGVPCKHRAVLIAHLDIRRPHVDRQWRTLMTARPARAA